jgi:hypothetical protein
METSLNQDWIERSQAMRLRDSTAVIDPLCKKLDFPDWERAEFRWPNARLVIHQGLKQSDQSLKQKQSETLQT